MPIFDGYSNVPNISTRLSIPSLVFSILTPLVVLARFATRYIHSNQIGPDDWTILASLVFAETVSVQMIICCEWGFGKHTWDLPAPIVNKTLELYFFAQILYKINIGLTKLSILLFYHRVFSVYRWLRRLCWMVAGIVIAFTIASVFSSIFQCTPVALAFDRTAGGGSGTCINLTIFWYANAAFNIGSDLVIIIIPIFVVQTLQLPTRSKIALCAVFGLGAFVCVTSILRITTLNLATTHTDEMWQSIDSSMWTVIESNLGIICASMPALKRPVSIAFPWLFNSVTRADRYDYQGRRWQSYTVFSNRWSAGSRGKKGSGNHGPESYRLEETNKSKESQDHILEAKEDPGPAVILHAKEVTIECDAMSKNPGFARSSPLDL